MVTCEPFATRSLLKSRPVLLVEVLSRAWGLTDRREILSAYFKLESLVEYVLIQEEKGLKFIAASDEVRFESPPNGALTLTMDEIYEDVIFAQPSKPREDE